MKHIYALILSACLCFHTADLFCGTSSNSPNVVVILADTLRTDRLGCYGDSGLTPSIDALSLKSAVYRHCISQGGWTKPSVGSLFTSLYPHSHGAVGSRGVLSKDVITMAEIFKDSGYITIGIQTNFHIRSKFHFNQGFDLYEEKVFNQNNSNHPGEKVVNDFFEILDKRKPKKFFGYLHFMDTHIPYRSNEELRAKYVEPYQGFLSKDTITAEERDVIRNKSSELTETDRRHVKQLYDASVAYLDSQIGRFTDGLRQRKLLDNTIIVLLSDHGEELFDHGGFEHSHSMYQEILHVPFIFYDPQIKQPVRVNEIVRVVDILPTLLSVCGIKSPKGIMGVDLSKSLKGKAIKSQGAFTEDVNNLERLAIQDNQYKLIYPTRGGVSEFYDLKSDPGEIRNLTGQPEEAKYKKLIKYHLKMGPKLVNENAEIDADERQKLKSLGYV